MHREYVVCSKPSCKFSAEGNELFLKGCPICGSDLLYRCPACEERILYKNALFCHACRKPIKPKLELVPEKKRPRT